MAAITFKAKPHDMLNADGSIAYRFVQAPKLTRSHCDMAAFRQHPRYGGLANSDLFPNLLSRIAHDRGLTGFVRLDRVPEGVTVETSGFLAVVSIDI